MSVVALWTGGERGGGFEGCHGAVGERVPGVGARDGSVGGGPVGAGEGGAGIVVRQGVDRRGEAGGGVGPGAGGERAAGRAGGAGRSGAAVRRGGGRGVTLCLNVFALKIVKTYREKYD